MIFPLNMCIDHVSIVKITLLEIFDMQVFFQFFHFFLIKEVCHYKML